ncbi:ribonuclease H-like domain-containing protein [Tanacetum coccineum]|uniref:Ribonuclease H-like domain-containing protein n=1 Tax=Tanacetum coccineum TaxID=301880 RepID=A0ABQ5I4A7_9ASTR
MSKTSHFKLVRVIELEIRIKQYFQIQDLCNMKGKRNWNSWNGKKNDDKARILLPHALPEMNISVTFNQNADLNLCFIAIKARLLQKLVKRTVAANNDDKNLAFLTTSSPSSTNTVNTANTGVSTGKVNTASTETSTASFSDATVYAFLREELKWNMALLSMRARKFYQRTGRKIVIDGSSTAGYDKSKVECFNCHKMGHFARECRVPRSKENRNWNQGNSSKAVRIEDASEKAMCAIDGGGFDWSDMAEDEVQANMALMAFSDSEVTDKSKRGFGYTAVPSPHPLILNRPTPLDLSYSGLEEFQQPLKINGALKTTVKNTKPLVLLGPVNTVRLLSTLGQKLYCQGKGIQCCKVSLSMLGLEPNKPIWCIIKPCKPYTYKDARADPSFEDMDAQGTCVWQENISSPFIRFLKNLNGGYVTLVEDANGGRITGISRRSDPAYPLTRFQDCIFMPIWKDASYFEDVSLQSVDDAQLQDQEIDS